MSRLFVALRATLYASCFVLLWTWLAIVVRPLDGSLGGPLPAWLRFAGVGLVLAGGPVCVSCIAVFVSSGRGTPAPFDAPREFVAVGPYRWMRNPMYLGAFALLGGVGFGLRSPAIVLLSMVALCLAHAFVLLYEEPTLRRRFGGAYESYTEEVNRWLPHVRWRTDLLGLRSGRLSQTRADKPTETRGHKAGSEEGQVVRKVGREFSRGDQADRHE